MNEKVQAIVEEALGMIAAEVANVVSVDVAQLRQPKNAADLAQRVRVAFGALRNRATPRGRALVGKEQVTTDVIAAKSIETLKARIKKLEAALADLGVDPITVRDEEPDGFRDPKHGSAGHVVDGAADDLAAAFQSSNEHPTAGEVEE